MVVDMKAFSYIQKHPVLFFWLSVLYMGVCSPICEVFIGLNWVHALVILPINLVTWPVAYALLGNGNWKMLNFIDRRFVFILPIASVALVIVSFF